MRFPTLRTWFASKPSNTVPSKDRSTLRVGIPKVLNIWNTHQFWVGFLTALGIKPINIIFSADSSEEQFREYGKGRGTVDCCYPVKSMSGHYGQLAFGLKKKIDILLSLRAEEKDRHPLEPDDLFPALLLDRARAGFDRLPAGNGGSREHQSRLYERG
ncbi:MAG: acyl-CoA dehydratase activase-related protein [Candidatus Tectomicrobia bacterium]